MTAPTQRSAEPRPDRRPPTPPGSLARASRAVPDLAALVVFVAGLVDLLSALLPRVGTRVDRIAIVLPGGLTHVALALTAMAGLLLLMLARGLHRRKRRAWRAAVLLLAAGAVLHLVHRHPIPGVAVSVVALALLVVFRDQFRARGDPRTRWSALGYGLGLAVVCLLLGLLLLALHGDAIAPHQGLWPRILQVVEGFVGFTGPLRLRADRFADLSYDVFAGMGWLIALTVGYLVLRPPEPAAMLSADDERRMRELLARHGDRDSLGYFSLRRDKSVVWSPSGKAAVAYRVVSGVMLASGDPLGDPEAWPGAIARFLEVAEEHAWVPAVMGCSEQAGVVWARHGLGALEIGDEAVVDVADFCLEGRAMRNVRQAVARAERAGYTARISRAGDLDPAERNQLANLAAVWRDSETERGFSMALGRFGDPADRDCVWVTAVLDGRVRALLHFVPWGRCGLSLDLMRRDRSADNGLNEFLIVSALRAAPTLGVTRVSLNFAVFRSALERGERLGAGFVLRAWRGLLLFVSRWFQIESLYRFNAKFHPMWEPRFACYPSPADIPRIALAALEAEAFLVWPTAWRGALARLRRRDRVGAEAA